MHYVTFGCGPVIHMPMSSEDLHNVACTFNSPSPSNQVVSLYRPWLYVQHLLLPPWKSWSGVNHNVGEAGPHDILCALICALAARVEAIISSTATR